MFLFVLTNDQDKVIVEDSYNQSRQRRCNTLRFTVTFTHSVIDYLSDYFKTVSSDFSLVKNGCEVFIGFRLFFASSIFSGKIEVYDLKNK